MKLNLLAILLCLHFFSFATETTPPQTPDYSAATDEQLESIDDTPFAPPQSRSSNVEIGQGQNKCRAFTGSTGSNPGLMDTRVLYSGPTYDKLLRLTQYQTIQLNNTALATPGGVIDHDTIVKLRCKGVTMAMFKESANGPETPVKEYYARCNNGYFYACKMDDTMHDQTMDKYYVKYSGNAKQCLTSLKMPAFACRPGCDVTRFIDSTKYQIDGKTYELADPIGYRFDGTIVEITYKQLLPQSTVTITCLNGTFLATSATGQDKSFEMSCDNNGVVVFPDDSDMAKNSTCGDQKACAIPSDTTNQRWGVYRAGSFIRPTTPIPSNGYISVKCGDDIRNDERQILCVNSKYFPNTANACSDTNNVEE